MEKKYIKKVSLSDGTKLYFYDEEAPRIDDLSAYLPLTGGTITGNLIIDEKLKTNQLQLLSIEYINPDDAEDVLLIDVAGNVKKYDIDNFLELIGGCSYKFTTPDTVKFKQGRQ